MPSAPKRHDWGAEGAPFQMMNIRPAAGQRWSDDPNFKGADFVSDPRSRSGESLQMYLDPEKHIERTSGYEGSTDRRHPGTGETQPTRDVWIDKKTEAKMPSTAKDHLGHKVHGAGIVESLQSGEKIRNPVRLIINKSRFPLAGNQPVQGEGHHRVAGSAVEQQAARERGDENWGRPVPFTLHHDPQEAKQADKLGSRMGRVQAALTSRAQSFKSALPFAGSVTLDTMPTMPPAAAPKRRWLRRG